MYTYLGGQRVWSRGTQIGWEIDRIGSTGRIE